MRVDVHTHVWPDRIAKVVLDSLVDHLGIAAIGLNTVDSLKAHMRESGVDKSVVLGVVERADLVQRANDWLISIQDDMLVPFGAIHPDLEDKAGEVNRLRQNGIKGIKLHPMMNSFYPDDPKMFPVYEEMGDDMVLVGHLPFMDRLAARLVVGREDVTLVAFHTSSCMCLERQDDGGWSVVWMLSPELLAD